ncbi:MAG: rhodanese-like domain-containing protein [Planctomycetia bacterium]|nr:rhodanese-like domain-containing protein [Planctomycetia bacterium]
MAAPSSLPLEVDCQSVNRDLAAGGEVVLLDCREPDEFQTAKISQAQFIPMSEITGRLAELSPHMERRIVVFCHLGGRSLRVAEWLRGQGFLKAQSLSGGIDRWACEIDASVPRY